jgi:Na+/H+-dicarboxylate symporter
MLDNIGIPQAGLALLLGVDRILDMCRTVINVLGDMAAAIVVDKYVSTESNLQQPSPSE